MTIRSKIFTENYLLELMGAAGRFYSLLLIHRLVNSLSVSLQEIWTKKMYSLILTWDALYRHPKLTTRKSQAL